VLIVTVYLYQYYSQTTIWWWLICYGFILDVLAISLAPLEVLSYSVSTCMMTLLASRVFTNRSFYGISATAILTLCVLLFSELGIIGMLHLVTQREFLWKHLLFSQLWALLFAGLLILFLFPLLRRAHVQFSKRILS
jgi:rod shape-determining protein MreD